MFSDMLAILGGGGSAALALSPAVSGRATAGADATIAVTVTRVVANFPALVARITVVPAFRPVTRPFAATVAIARFSEVHVIVEPVTA
jgi:hypothetical protein